MAKLPRLLFLRNSFGADKRSSLVKTMTTETIAIFLPSLHGGGAERVAVTLANAIAARGYPVDLVLAIAEGPYLERVAPNVRVVDLRAERVKALVPLCKYLRRERPAVMLSMINLANVIALVARNLARTNTRLIISERATISVEAKHKAGLKARIFYGLIPWLYKFSDSITAVSLSAARDLEQFARLPPHSVEVIYNPFDLQHITKLANEPINHPWFSADKPPVVLGVGRLVEQKDFSTLIHAFALLRRQIEARLLILGEGRLRNALEAQARACGLSSEDFQMPGFVANPYAYMAKARLFVLSSRWEGLPGVLVEAMACGTPVVSTDCLSGPREILEDGRWGRLVPVGDGEALAKTMYEVLTTEPEELPDVRRRANDFELTRAVDAFLKVLGFPSYPKTQEAL